MWNKKCFTKYKQACEKRVVEYNKLEKELEVYAEWDKRRKDYGVPSAGIILKRCPCCGKKLKKSRHIVKSFNLCFYWFCEKCEYADEILRFFN